MKIDLFNHIFPRKFFDKMLAVAPQHGDMGKRVRNIPVLVDLDLRMRQMDEFGAYKQILSLASPPLEVIASPAVTPELARLGNDGMAELVAKHPDRFAGFTASLPMNNIDATLAETQRVVKDLNACGVQIFTNVNGRPLDEPEFFPLFEAMAKHDLPIWLHPGRGANFPDYPTEKKSKYEIWWTFGWPYETSTCMARMVFSGILDKLPKLKVITHHMGAMIPYFEGRVGPGWDQLGARTSDEDYTKIVKAMNAKGRRPIDYFRMFYADTALFGSVSGTQCGLDFFGVDKVVFASDSPFDPEKGPMYIRETIKIIDNLGLSAADKEKIYRGNAERLMNRKFA
jgi:predicted TIM-barrel fold metal-dependent hydrolase